MSAQQTPDKWEDLDLEAIFQRSGVLTAAQLTQELDPDAINAEGCRAFVARHAIQTDFNVEALYDWCKSRDVPMTVKNLEIAMADIKQRGLWDNTPITPVETSRAAAVDSVPVENDPAALRKLPLDQLKKLIETEKRQAATPQAEVSILEDEIDGGTTVTQVAEPNVETEADLRKLPLAELRKRATADRWARRTSPGNAIR